MHAPEKQLMMNLYAGYDLLQMLRSIRDSEDCRPHRRSFV